LGRRMNGLIDGLLAVLARIEAYIDFPDEDLPPEDRDAVLDGIARLKTETGRLLATSHYGEVLRDGIKTVIVGEPNVGKSSLLNRLVGRQRAIVSPEPGTTRDFIEERILVGPHCLRLVDTAGLNPSPAPLERLGMEKTRERIAEADLLLVVMDASKNGRSAPPDLGASAEEKSLYIFNKNDLRCKVPVAVCDQPAPLQPALRLSALTGEGIGELVAAIAARADAF